MKTDFKTDFALLDRLFVSDSFGLLPVPADRVGLLPPDECGCALCCGADGSEVAR